MDNYTNESKSEGKFKKIAIPIVIVLFAALIMVALIKMRPAPKKAPPRTDGVLVKTEQIKLEELTIEVRATATVRATQNVSVIPQVSGVVKSTAVGFVEGGFFKKGQVLFKIDGTDYRLALRSAEAVEAQAEVELETIKSRADIARKEWEIMSKGAQDSSAPNPLVLYEPQMKNARAMRESAAAKVEQARLNLERTVLRAPFDCRLRSKTIDIGQYIKTGTPVAVLAGTGSAEVVIPLERHELEWLTIPAPGDSSRIGSMATITVSGVDDTWSGRIVRTLGEVDMKSRMVQVVVQVDDPYGLKSGGGSPLMDGSFVSLAIKGRILKNVASIPRSAVRDNNTVWIMDNEGILRVRDINIARMAYDSAIVDRGIEDMDLIVLSKVSGAADGMKLRMAGAKPEVSNTLTPIKNSTAISNSPETEESK